MQSLKRLEMRLDSIHTKTLSAMYYNRKCKFCSKTFRKKTYIFIFKQHLDDNQASQYYENISLHQLFT